MQRRDLEGSSRDELIARAERLGVTRPRVLTQAELIDEILARSAKNAHDRTRARGWLGRARDLLASGGERGLHLPDAARALRGGPAPRWPSAPPPLPTVTLAEIYAAQGHLDRAVGVLDEVLAREPEHDEARRMRERFAASARTAKPAAPDEEPASAAEPERDADAAAPADDAASALPDRYEVDEIVAIAVDPETVYLYWEVRPTTLARARARRPEGKMVIRAVCVAPSWDGPALETREIPIDELYGDLFVRGVAPGSNVRVSVGWIAGGDFDPFAVGDELAAPHVAASAALGSAVARWAPSPLPGLGGGPGPHTFGTALQRMRRQVGQVAWGAMTPGGGDALQAGAGGSGGGGAFARPGDAAGVAGAPISRRVHETISRRPGSSELVRETREERLGGPGRPGRGGASELGRSSELGRAPR